MAALTYTKFISAKATCTLLFAAWLYAFWPTIHLESQGLLALPLIFLFIYTKKTSLNRATMIYNQYGLVLLLSSTLLWLFAVFSELNILSQVAMISILISIIVTTCGKKITGILMLPLLCLYLLLPISTDVFKTISQGFSILLVKALSASNLDVYWETQRIYFKDNVYNIHDYLGSFKYAILFITAGCAVAILRTKSFVVFLAIVTSFVIMPLISLWLTIYSFILFNNIWQPINLSQKSIIIIGWVCTLIGVLHAVVLSKFLGGKLSLERSQDIDWHSSHITRKINWLLPLAIASFIILMAPLAQKYIHWVITW